MYVCKETVDECSPAEYEEHCWEKSSSFEHCTRQDHCGGSDESKVECSEKDIWDCDIRLRAVSESVS